MANGTGTPAARSSETARDRPRASTWEHDFAESSSPDSEIGSVVFVVPGEPAAQGSKRGFVNPKTGGVILTDTSRKLKPWRSTIATTAAEARGARALFEGPVRVRVRFTFARPKTHYGSGRKADALKPTAPRYLTSRQKGDIDKLLRALLDGLTSILFADDAQVVEVSAVKAYGVTPCARVEVTPIQ